MSSNQGRHDQICEEEVSDVVCCELHFIAVRGEFQCLYSHQSCDKEKAVKLFVFAVEFLSCFSDRGERSQIYLQELNGNVCIGLAYLLDDWFNFRSSPTG